VEAQPEDPLRVSSFIRTVAASAALGKRIRFFENKGRYLGRVVEGNSVTASEASAAIGGKRTIFLLAFVSSMIGYSNSPIEAPFVLVQSAKQKSSTMGVLPTGLNEVKLY
jgi:hypothetical protein